jgi:hypothetical protein
MRPAERMIGSPRARRSHRNDACLLLPHRHRASENRATCRTAPGSAGEIPAARRRPTQAITGTLQPAAQAAPGFEKALQSASILQDVVHLGPHHRTQIVNAGNRGHPGHAAKNISAGNRGSPLIIRVTRCPPAEWPVSRIGPAILLRLQKPIAAAISPRDIGNREPPGTRCSSASPRHTHAQADRPPDATRQICRTPSSSRHARTHQPFGFALRQKQIKQRWRPPGP